MVINFRLYDNCSDKINEDCHVQIPEIYSRAIFQYFGASLVTSRAYTPTVFMISDLAYKTERKLFLTII